MNRSGSITKDTVDAVVRLGEMALAFGRVMRATYHEDGLRRESDTDHTVMLGLVALAFAERFAPHLDRGLIAEYAFVHDLPEVYAGDVVTARALTKEEKENKDQQEKEALARIRREFDTQLPWVGSTIHAYESLATPEARFVKVIDKVMPKIAHLLNAGKTLEELNIGEEELRAIHIDQWETLSGSYGHDQAEALALHRALSHAVHCALYEADAVEEEGLSAEAIDAVLRLGKLALVFARVNRITCHPDGVTAESDTDHTVMLGLVACAFAERFVPTLDRGRVAEFALVHDLVEVYAGDTAAARIMTDVDHSNKEEREMAALARIKAEFDTEFPWLGNTIEVYEKRGTPEARFVKVIDKTLPKITNILNSGVTFRGQKHDAVSGKEFLMHQREKLSTTYGEDQSEAMALLVALGDEMLDTIFK